MHLEEVILDGFKSYAYYTSIKPLDPQFTAVTGLNGSGKSNILDAICFVLGITSLQRIRVNSLTELIYKQAQAGVTKATVSLVFNNENVATSPQGFENEPRITITRTIFANGTTKYLINNQTAKIKTLKQLFQSVNMNINNPNFLIMYGRIYAILTMKPYQLLSLLEETAGTSLYEQNRKEAVKTFDQKQAKLAQIEKIINEDITPKIEKLERERRIGVEIAYVYRAIGVFEVIYEFAGIIECQQKQDDLEKNLESMRIKESLMKKSLQDLDNQFIYMNAELANKQATTGDQETELLYRQIDYAEGYLAIQQQKVDFQKQKLDENMLAISKKQRMISQLYQQIEQAEMRIKDLEGAYSAEKARRIGEAIEQHKARYSALNAEIALLRTGEVDRDFMSYFSTKDNKECIEYLKAQLFGEQDFLSMNEIASRLQYLYIMQQAEVYDLNNERHEINDNIVSYYAELNNAKTDDLSNESNIYQQKYRIQAYIQLFLKKYQLTAPALDDSAQLKQFSAYLKLYLEQEKRTLNRERTDVEDEIARRNASAQQLKQQFFDALLKQLRSSPAIINMVDNIADRARIGLVGTVLEMADINRQLIESLKVDQTKLLKAIEIAGGAKLFNLIFNTQGDAASFVTSKQCTQRVTCLPIDNIRGKQLQQSYVYILQANKGYLLSDFLKPKNSDLGPIFQFLFGSTAIVATLRDAKSVAYDKQCAIKCVTLDGDVVDPSGVVTGGSRHNSSASSFLRFYMEMMNFQASGVPRGNNEAFSAFAKMEYLYESFYLCVGRYLGDLTQFRAESRSEKIARDIRVLYAKNEGLEVYRVRKMAHLAVMDVLYQAVKYYCGVAPTRSTAEIEAEQSSVRDALARLEEELDQLCSTSGMSQARALRLTLHGHLGEHETAHKDVEQLETQRKDLDGALVQETARQYAFDYKLHNLMLQMADRREECERQVAVAARTVRAVTELEQRLNQEREVFYRYLLTLKDAEAQLTRIGRVFAQHAENVQEFSGVFAHIFGSAAAVRLSGHRRAQLSLEAYAQQLSDAKLGILLNGASTKDGARAQGGDYTAEQCPSAEYAAVQVSGQEAVEFTRDLVEKGRIAELLSAKQQYLYELHKAYQGFSGTTANLEEMQKSARQLISMYQRLQRDREKIISVIERVDEKKEQAVREVYTSVNNSLGEIFAALLPGAHAALQRLAEGVQFAIQLGSTKTTLSGLSGGQKSLLALSFTLALLKFKPSPIYILDEIDAALDLSHTHNIGRLIYEYFGGSQFIIVSLKEGMFNHANRLIKVRFSEGMSKVEIVK